MMVMVIILTQAVAADILTQLDLEDDGRFAVHSGRTMASIEILRLLNYTSCDLAIVEESDKPDVLADLEMMNVSTVGVNFTTMMEVIFLCEELSEKDDMSTRVDMEVVEDTGGFWNSFVRGFQTLTKGIAPGTLWCGTNDIAPHYKSLGEDKSLDKCCRVHDFCPDKIKPGKSREGIMNPDLVTKSNCECERLFAECLTNVGTFSSKSVGNLYFGTNRECIEMRHPKRCLEWEFSNDTTSKSDEFYNKGNDTEQSNHTRMVETLFNSTTEVDDDDDGIESIDFSMEDDDNTVPVPLKYCSKFIEDLEQPLELQLVKNLKF